MQRTSHVIHFSCIVALAALLLAGCGRAAGPAEAPTAEPTQEPLRYASEAGGFSLQLPAGWTMEEESDTPLGTALYLKPAPPAEDGRESVLYIAPTAVLDRHTALAALCPDCTVETDLNEIVLSGRPAWTANLADETGAIRTWTIVENGDVLVVFSIVDPATGEPAAAIIDSLRFTPVVDAPARAEAMAEAMRAAIAQLNDAPDAVTIAAIDAVTWPDACLDAPLADEMCAQAETPGYRVTITAPAGDYRFHFDPVTTQIRLAAAPAVEIGAPQMEWRSSGFPCEMVRIGREGVAFGACGSEVLLGGPALGGARGTLMQDLLRTLAPFEAETPAGFVAFFGGGARAATPAEQRQLAELARLVLADAGGGSGGEAALTWRREGGVAGFCDALTIQLSGETEAHSCRMGSEAEAQTALLDLEELVQLYTWYDLLGPGTIEVTDETERSALTVALDFTGAGPGTPVDADLEPMLTYAAAVFAETVGSDDRAGASADVPDECPAAGPNEALLSAPELGFCLLYPATFALFRPIPGEVVLAVDSLLNVSDPRVMIEVSPAEGKTLEEWAATEAETHGVTAAPLETVLAGQPALVFENVPGQDLSRVVLLGAGERFYRLTFVPVGEAYGEAAAQTEALYRQVTESFTLLR